MSALLESIIGAARRDECDRNDKLLRINFGPAKPVSGDSIDLVLGALDAGVGRVEVFPAPGVDLDALRCGGAI